jgi:hypothetical protein
MFNFLANLFDHFGSPSATDTVGLHSDEVAPCASSAADSRHDSEPSPFNQWGTAADFQIPAEFGAAYPTHSSTTEMFGSYDSGSSWNSSSSSFDF